VRWHPILLGVIFKATGSAPLTLQAPAKAAYSIHDFERSARFMGIPYRPEPLPARHAERRPRLLLAARPGLRAGPAVRPRGLSGAVCRRQDISAPETVIEIAAKLASTAAIWKMRCKARKSRLDSRTKSISAENRRFRLALRDHRRRSLFWRRPPAADRKMAGNRGF
jgi:2-hydroxychromene-2-carboxylate isomerase